MFYVEGKFKEIETKVVDIKYYKDFGKAFQDLGEALLPNTKTAIEASITYLTIYNKQKDHDDIATHGVVAFELKLN